MIEGLAGAQAIALQLSYLVGLAQRPQHAEGGASANVAADAHPHWCCQQAGRRNSPLPRNRFDVGQKATADPVSCRHCHSASSRWIP